MLIEATKRPSTMAQSAVDKQLSGMNGPVLGFWTNFMLKPPIFAPFHQHCYVL